MAEHGTVRPRRYELQTLPRAVPPDHPVRPDEIHRNLQRLGRLFRHPRRSGDRRHAADARLRGLLRIPADAAPERSVARSPAGRGRTRRELRPDHLDLQRLVAVHDRRHGRVHLARPVQDQNYRPHPPFHQRLRRRGDRRQRRNGAAGRVRSHRRPDRRIYGRPGLHDRPIQRIAPVDRRVQRAARRHGTLCRRTGTARCSRSTPTTKPNVSKIPRCCAPR